MRIYAKMSKGISSFQDIIVYLYQSKMRIYAKISKGL